MAISEFPSWIENQQGSIELVKDGAPPYSCSIINGSLPVWLSFNGCTLSGTAPPLEPGSSVSVSPTFTVEATDSSNPAGSIAFYMGVIITRTPLKLTLNDVTCSVNSECGANLIAGTTGGNPPYQYQLNSMMEGQPPLGTFVGDDGTLDGTPTTEGKYTFSVCAIDSDSSSECKNATATIQPAQKFTLSVVKSGQGSGTVQEAPFNSNLQYDAGTNVVVTATPDQNSIFTGWSGGECTGNSVCSVVMNSNKNIIANFGQGSKETLYSGPFNFEANYGRPFPEWGTTCTFDDVFSGRIDVSLIEAPSGTISGTIHIVGTFTSTAISGNTAQFTCLNSQTPMDDTAQSISGTKSNLQFSTSFITAGGSRYVGAFTGSADQNSITGTFRESSSCCSGSGSQSITLSKVG